MSGDLRGRLGPVGVWGHLDSLPIDGLRDYIRLVERLGYGALWVPETVGREPFALLALLAGTTERLMLGTSIASIYARDAITARTAAMTLHEASAGRFVLGLGVSHPHLVTKVRGHEYSRPVTRMREYLDAYRAAPYRGPQFHGKTAGDSPADDGPADAGPPIVLAALRRRMTELAGSQTAGVFPYLVTADRVAAMRAWVDEAAPAGTKPLLAVTLPVALGGNNSPGRDAARGYLVPYLRTPNYQASFEQQGFTERDWEQPGSDRLVDELIAIGSEDEIAERVRKMHASGADHVCLIPLDRDGTTEEAATLEALAAALVP